ncbi:MAG: DUF2062 domain-containing protein [Deltaproteobacteria bacterium]|nr:DUF2062 domain-containing protein [Deltaproteobacteria bacterium]
MNFERQLKYYYIKLIGLRDEPHELALGIALGIFTGMMPIIPFQTALAVTLALFFKASKITAALYYSYKVGTFLLGIPEKKAIFSSITAAMKSGEAPMVLVAKIVHAGSTIVAAFLVGGFVMGIVFGAPSYFVFLRFFKYVRAWRRSRKERGNWRIPDR